MISKSMFFASLLGLTLAIGCNSNAGGQQTADKTQIPAGIYEGNSTCHYEAYDGSTNQTETSQDTSDDSTEINDNGIVVLDNDEAHIGQVTTFHFGGIDGRATVKTISTTDDKIIVTMDVIYTIDDGTGYPLDLEGTATYTVRAEGANRIRETGEVFVSYLDEFGILSLSVNCEAVLTQ